MSEQWHSKSCLEAQAEAEAFVKKYPDHCQHCCAMGYWYSAGNYNTPPDGGPCGFCVEKNICPLCAGELPWDDEKCESGPCKECGWNEKEACVSGQTKWPTYPEYECWCWEMCRQPGCEGNLEYDYEAGTNKCTTCGTIKKED